MSPPRASRPRAAERLFDAVVEVHKDGVAVAIVEQNANEALAIADRAYILVDGKNSRTGAAKRAGRRSGNQKALSRGLTSA